MAFQVHQPCFISRFSLLLTGNYPLKAKVKSNFTYKFAWVFYSNWPQPFFVFWRNFGSNSVNYNYYLGFIDSVMPSSTGHLYDSQANNARLCPFKYHHYIGFSWVSSAFAAGQTDTLAFSWLVIFIMMYMLFLIVSSSGLTCITYSTCFAIILPRSCWETKGFILKDKPFYFLKLHSWPPLIDSPSVCTGSFRKKIILFLI